MEEVSHRKALLLGGFPSVGSIATSSVRKHRARNRVGRPFTQNRTALLVIRIGRLESTVAVEMIPISFAGGAVAPTRAKLASNLQRGGLHLVEARTQAQHNGNANGRSRKMHKTADARPKRIAATAHCPCLCWYLPTYLPTDVSDVSDKCLTNVGAMAAPFLAKDA